MTNVTPKSLFESRLDKQSRGDVAVTDAVKARVIELLLSGAFLADIERMPDMPTTSAIAKARTTDAVFDASMAQALAVLADTAIQESATFARHAASHSLESARVAEIYARSIAALAEKISPKTHGALLKVAGSDGGALTVAVVDYSKVSKPNAK
jgi:hypothetical protein